MPETSLCAGDTAVKKIHKFPSLFWQGEQMLSEEITWDLGHFRGW